ncbi:hypothetical protein [Streptomyces sp. MS2.AVA.5]|uniref:Uncharacterized protein n=1 Tax=Streptomyces achmelvichensis TaxID=3134111 RepID=A0ACC6Q8G3_9ACTN
MTIDFIGEIHPLIAHFRAMTTRHQSEQARRTPDGTDPRADQPRGEDARIEHDRECAEQLTAVMERLLQLCGPPLPGHAHTLTFAGPERHDGEAPYAFVVNGESITDARLSLGALPGFCQWYDEQRSWNEPEADPDVVFLADESDSHCGLPAAGFYNDLRREQAAMREAETVASELASSIPELEG